MATRAYRLKLVVPRDRSAEAIPKREALWTTLGRSLRVRHGGCLSGEEATTRPQENGIPHVTLPAKNILILAAALLLGARPVSAQQV